MANNLLSQILDIVIILLTGKKPAPEAVSEQPASVNKTEPPVIEQEPELDWSKDELKISKYFTVKEAIYLPTWKRLANKEDGLNDTIKENSLRLFKQMDVVREHFGKPIRAHVAYRPVEYNKAIGGAQHSAHSEGMAFDFDIIGMSCDDVRKELTKDNNKLLEEWKMRCEDMPGSTWVHLDIRELAPEGHRFFKP